VLKTNTEALKVEEEDGTAFVAFARVFSGWEVFGGNKVDD
jgi:hypothetical protein